MSVSVDVVIQQAKHMRHIIFSSVAVLSVPYFLTYHKMPDFNEDFFEHLF
jgi:hypothetical protein